VTDGAVALTGHNIDLPRREVAASCGAAHGVLRPSRPWPKRPDGAVPGSPRGDADIARASATSGLEVCRSCRPGQASVHERLGDTPGAGDHDFKRRGGFERMVPQCSGRHGVNQ